MDFLDLEENSGGDSTLYTRPPIGVIGEKPQDELFGIFSAAEPQPASLLESPPVGNQPILSQEHGQPLYANSYYQCAFAWPPVAELDENTINGETPQEELLGAFSTAAPQPVTLFEHPLVGSQPILSQGHDQPLYANSFYQRTSAWPPIAESDENIINGGDPQDELLGIFSVAASQTAALFEYSPVSNQPILSQGQQAQPLYTNGLYEHAPAWLPVAEHQENTINAENPHAELEPADPQPHYVLPPALPVIHSNPADESGSRPGQEFRCNNKCRGVFAGPHKCSYHGRSLTISCREDDENCPSKFSKRNDFNRHCDTVHRSARAGAPVKRLLDCPFYGCERVGENGFKRKDNLTQHRRSVHEEKIAKNPIRFGRGNDVV